MTNFYKKLLTLGVPILVQNIITSSLNFIDVFMVGQLGETEIAAVGLANQVYFIYIMVVFGISSGTGIFSAQYWGKKNIKSIKSVLGIGYVSCFIVTALFLIGTLFFPKHIIALFSKDPEVIKIGARYLWIVGFSYPATVITILINGVLRSTEEVTIPLITGSIGIVLNSFLNYILIFGAFGAPVMGVEGAAWATLCARFIGTAVLIIVVYYKKLPAAGNFKELFSFDKGLLKEYMSKSLPVVIQNVAWVAGSSMYVVVYGRLGTDSMAAVNVVGSVEKICIMFFSALGHSARTMIGNLLGKKENSEASSYGWRFLKLSVISAVLFSFVVILLRYKIASIYTLSDQSLIYAENLLFVMAVGLIFKAGNISLMMGALQSGGDTKFAMFVDTIGVWCIGVPIAFLTGFFFKLPVYYVAAFVLIEEVSKMTAGVIRLKSGKWINNLV